MHKLDYTEIVSWESTLLQMVKIHQFEKRIVKTDEIEGSTLSNTSHIPVFLIVEILIILEVL